MKSRTTTDARGDNAQKSFAVATELVADIRRGGKLGAFLDAGCGIGSLLRAADPFATATTGVDAVEDFLADARANAPRARIERTDLADLSLFADDSFDTIAFCDVIEHLGNPVAALAELHRVLRPGGRLAITTPNSGSIQRLVLGKRWHGLADATHILLYNAFSLTVLLERSGYAVRERRTLSGPFLPKPVQHVVNFARQGAALFFIAEKIARGRAPASTNRTADR